MFRQLKKNNSGVILVTVLIMTLVMSILAIGILSMNVSQVMTSEDVKRSLVAEYFARKVLWTIQANVFNGLLPIASSVNEVIDGVINDTFDCSRDETRCVYGYYSQVE